MELINNTLKKPDKSIPGCDGVCHWLINLLDPVPVDSLYSKIGVVFVYNGPKLRKVLLKFRLTKNRY